MEGKVYVGDLGSSATKQDLEDAFNPFGRLRNVWVARNPPGFAFVEFEDGRDAEDAVRALDGRTICGRRARVELSTGKSRNRNRGPPPRRGGGGGGGGRPFRSEDRCYECGERGHFARNCHNGGGRGDGRSWNQSSSRYSRSRSRSRTPRRRSYSRSRSRSLSKSRRQSRSQSRNRSVSRGRSGTRSRTPENRRSPSLPHNGNHKEEEN